MFIGIDYHKRYSVYCAVNDRGEILAYQGKLMRACNKWLRWVFVEAAWVSVGCFPDFGAFSKAKRTLGQDGGPGIWLSRNGWGP